jgi:GNAT superfamily N-acetyltransferase
MRNWIKLVEQAQSPSHILVQRVADMRLPARVTVHPLDGYTAEVTDLEATERGQGQGRVTMRAIIEIADELGVTLELWPVIDDAVEDGLDADVLRRWYKRLGFALIPNRDPDDDMEFDRYLVRTPHHKLPERAGA